MKHDLAQAQRRLLDRWPETRLDPTLQRIDALLNYMGRPERSFSAVHVTGTNGKTSTAIMIDHLMRATGLTTGRFTSPHLESVLERVSLHGEPITPQAFLRSLSNVEAAAAAIEHTFPVPLSFFEMMVATGYQAFADAGLDAAVVEVGMGGTWDATNVVDAGVAVVGTVDLDHQEYLGSTRARIAAEKAGIIKEGRTAVVGRQHPDAADVIDQRVRSAGATAAWLGQEFDVTARAVDEHGQRLTLRGLHDSYEIVLPLRGRHQADNAAVAVAAAEAFVGRALTPAEVSAGLADVRSPGRLDVIWGAPTVLIDAAHNPHGIAAGVEAATEFVKEPLTVVLAVMADKDHEGMVERMAPAVAHLICTTNSSPRTQDPDVLARTAHAHLPAERVSSERDMPRAIEVARNLGRPILVTGSVVTAGDALALLRKESGRGPRRRN